NAITRHDTGSIVPLAGAILAAALLRLGLTFIRRLIAGRESVGAESELRGRFYAHLQPLAVRVFRARPTRPLKFRAAVGLHALRSPTRRPTSRSATGSSS